MFERLAEGVRTFLAQHALTTMMGVTARDWLRLLAENRLRIDFPFWPRAGLLTFACGFNSLFAALERHRFGREIDSIEIPPPLFVLGHWRSGTTHLHNLLSVDDRFAFANSYQTIFPRGFLRTEEKQSRFWSRFVPGTRLFDNVKFGLDVPAEDEFAVCTLTFISPYMTWAFYRRRAHYDRFLTMRQATADEIERWKRGMREFMAKLAIKYRRPLILKSPPHTCRIKLLLELFPNARFVHIRRNPYTVFQSTRRMTEVFIRSTQLQRFPLEAIEERILRQYREMYDAFFEEKDLAPPGRFHEVHFEQLDQDPMGEIERVYKALELPDFSVAEPKIKAYADSVADYKKSGYRELPADLRDKIATQWRPCFDAWGYEI